MTPVIGPSRYESAAAWFELRPELAEGDAACAATGEALTGAQPELEAFPAATFGAAFVCTQPVAGATLGEAAGRSALMKPTPVVAFIGGEGGVLGTGVHPEFEREFVAGAAEAGATPLQTGDGAGVGAGTAGVGTGVHCAPAALDPMTSAGGAGEAGATTFPQPPQNLASGDMF